METEQICVCLPVRYGSVRLPGKALMKLGNLTVIERTLTQLMKSKYLKNEQIFVFTDDHRIAQVVEKFQVGVIMTNSLCENALVRLSRYIDHIPEQYQYIINLHGDEPLLDARNIDYVIEEVGKLDYNDNGMGIQLIREIPSYEALELSQVKAVMNLNSELIYCSRAWLPHTKNGEIRENGVKYYGIVGVHLVDRESLRRYDLEEKAILWRIEDVEELKLVEMGVKMKCLITPFPTERSLNTPEDYEYFRSLID